jgi:hypothetical protein
MNVVDFCPQSLQTQFKHGLIDRTSAGSLVHAVANGCVPSPDLDPYCRSQRRPRLEDVACGWDHLPALQSRFLRRILRAQLPDFDPPPRPACARPAWTQGVPPTPPPPQQNSIAATPAPDAQQDWLTSFEPRDIDREFFESASIYLIPLSLPGLTPCFRHWWSPSRGLSISGLETMGTTVTRTSLVVRILFWCSTYVLDRCCSPQNIYCEEKHFVSSFGHANISSSRAV